MAARLLRIPFIVILIFSALSEQAFSGFAQNSNNPVYIPIVNNGQISKRQLTICIGEEPDSLYLYGSNMLSAMHVWQAIYDGPMDNNTFEYQPVILEKIPSLADGDAVITPHAVQTGDTVIDSIGDPVILAAGTIVRPSGCRSEECAIVYNGTSPLEMDQMTVTFQMLPNLRWSDNIPLTAMDSVYSFNLASAPDTPAIKDVIERTESYSAIDELQVSWKGLPGYLNANYATFFWSPLPEHLWGTYSALELLTAEVSTKRPIGWGAYIINEWIPGEQISLHKNPIYFRSDEDLPRFSNLVFRFIGGDPINAIVEVLAGKCDIVDQTTSLDSQAQFLFALEEAGLIDAAFTSGKIYEHVDFNIQPAETIINTGAFAGWDEDINGDGPYGDVRLRQAIAMCMDRQAVIDQVIYGHSELLDSYVPQTHPLYNPAVSHWPYDPAAAAILLDEIGWLDDDQDPNTPRIAQGVTGVPDGTLLQFLYETTTATLRQQVTQVLANSMAGCGIGVELVYHPALEWFQDGPEGRLFGRKFDLGEYAWLTGVIPPCNLYLSTQVPRPENGWMGTNSTGFHDPAFDSACNMQGQVLPGEPDYGVAAWEAQGIFAEQVPSIPLFLRYYVNAARPDTCNFIPDQTNPSEMWNIERFDYGEGCSK
jgi:peptide/nickel transport system substrate-binding protein